MENEEKCKECGKAFSTLKSLHSHVKKAHNIYLADYYEKHFPRYCWYSKEKIVYKDYNDYINKYFLNDDNMNKWIVRESKKNPEKVKKWIVDRLKNRIESKNLSYAPSFNELETTNQMPNTKVFSQLFGSYNIFCESIGIEPLLYEATDFEKVSIPKDCVIIIDTREQNPILFKNSKIQKLAFGDYTLSGEHYTSTYIDRKSSGDFVSTMSQGFDRFCFEMEKCVAADSYMYVVVEDSISNIISKNDFIYSPAKLSFVFKRMRELQHKFPRKVQFIFSGNRANSQKLYPWLLYCGEKLWKIDVQNLLIHKGFFYARKR